MSALSADWLTPFEKSGGLDSPAYDETLAWFRRLAAHSPEAHLVPFGTSPQGRELVALVCGRAGHLAPETAHGGGRAVVLIQNGIHAGEIEGKDASMLLLREILVTKEKAHLLERLVLVVIPVFNVDGHELRSPFGRPNQNGPRLMGWRTNALNLNLNRDYAKADSPEMRAWLSLFSAWNPDFVIDNHATNGADYRYHVTYGIETHENIDRGLAAFAKYRLMPYVFAHVEAAGFLMAPYVQLRGSGISEGLVDHPGSPRTSTGYAAARNRLALLVETHSLKPFENRVRSTKATNEAVLQFLSQNVEDLIRENRDAERRNAHAFLEMKEPFPLVVEAGDDTEPFLFKGFQIEVEDSEVTGGPVVRYSTVPENKTVPLYASSDVTRTVAVPKAYLVPREFARVLEVLSAHGIAMRPFSADGEEWDVERYRFTSCRFWSNPYEGRQLVDVEVELEASGREDLRPADGDFVVPTAQPALRLIVHLLEPCGPESFVKWGFFNAFFERKEYAESYVMEPIAARMLKEDPELAREFREELDKDERFRRDPGLRLDFFYRRSPYFDRHQNVYPVLRLFDKSHKPEES